MIRNAKNLAKETHAPIDNFSCISYNNPAAFLQCRKSMQSKEQQTAAATAATTTVMTTAAPAPSPATSVLRRCLSICLSVSLLLSVCPACDYLGWVSEQKFLIKIHTQYVAHTQRCATTTLASHSLLISALKLCAYHVI